MTDQVSHIEILDCVNRLDKEVEVLKTEVHGELKNVKQTLEQVRTDTAANQLLAQEAVTRMKGQDLAFKYLGWVAGIAGTVAAALALL